MVLDISKEEEKVEAAPTDQIVDRIKGIG